MSHHNRQLNRICSGRDASPLCIPELERVSYTNYCDHTSRPCDIDTTSIIQHYGTNILHRVATAFKLGLKK